jgi:hypothetical protein
MNDDPVRSLWQSTPKETDKDMTQMIDAIQRRAKAFHRTIFWRDVREIGAAVVVVPIFVYVAIQARPSPLISGGFFLLAASCLFIAGWLYRSRRGGPKPAPEESVAAYGRTLLASYDRQIALLRTAKYWYVLPLYAGMLAVYAGMISKIAAPLGRLREQAPERWLLGVAFLVLVFVFLTAASGFVWWLNERYAVRKLTAERESLAAMLPSV